MLELTWRRGSDLSTREFHDLLELRIDVFVVEQKCAYREIDGRDLLATTWHGWVLDPATGHIAASVRLLCDMEPAQIGRVVTRHSFRGEGLAAAVVEAAHDRAGGAGSFLEAQRHLAEWYESLGWTVSGDAFVEDGIAHVPMRRVRAG